ncbi:hypothetical protein [Liquorilactobacillus capillatus]|nr:hypothetical protein [Liquorilactobacillus capillatus]
MNDDEEKARILRETRRLQQEIHSEQIKIVQKYSELNKLYQLLDSKQTVSQPSNKHDAGTISGDNHAIDDSLRNTTTGFSEKALTELRKYKAPERVRWWQFFWKQQ